MCLDRIVVNAGKKKTSSLAFETLSELVVT
jgi:hypothetical protein